MYRNVINYWIPYSVVKNRQHTELRPWHLPAVSPTSLIPWSLFPLSAARPEEVRSDGRCKGSDDLAKQRSCHLHFRGPQKDWRSSSLRYMSDGHWWSLMVIDGHWWSLMVIDGLRFNLLIFLGTPQPQTRRPSNGETPGTCMTCQFLFIPVYNHKSYQSGHPNSCQAKISKK